MPANEPHDLSRKAVGVYDRPASADRSRTRIMVIVIAVSIAVAIGWALYFI